VDANTQGPVTGGLGEGGKAAGHGEGQQGQGGKTEVHMWGSLEV